MEKLLTIYQRRGGAVPFEISTAGGLFTIQGVDASGWFFGHRFGEDPTRLQYFGDTSLCQEVGATAVAVMSGGCTCELASLMSAGCRCGAMERERAS